MERNCFTLAITVCLILVVTSHVDCSAKVEWEVIRDVRIEQNPIAATTSLDGQYLYILVEGKLLMYSLSKWKGAHVIPVERSFDMMTVSEMNQLIILMSSSQKTIRFLRIDFIHEFEVGGLPFQGGQNAPVSIVAFMDYECPNCAQLNLILQQVQNQYQDKIRLVLKNLPNNEASFKSAAAALAAHKQNRYWEFHNLLFTETDKLNQERIDNITAQIGLDKNKLATEMQSPEIQDLINRDIKDATEANISEVPTVFINGRRLYEHNLDAIQRMIDDELMKKSQPKPPAKQ